MEGNIIAKTPLVNQNEPPVEQPAPQMRAPDVVISPQLLQMVRHDLSTDPLQNELTTLRKLQKALSERHNEEVFPFLASLYLLIGCCSSTCTIL